MGQILPLAAIMERTSKAAANVSYKNLIEESPSAFNWTDDESWAISVNRRFVAKNKRTLRAKRAKQERLGGGGDFKLKLPPQFSESDTEPDIDSPFRQVEQNKLFSRSDPAIIGTRSGTTSNSSSSQHKIPLLSDVDTSINVQPVLRPS